MTHPLVLAIAANREISLVRERGQRVQQVRRVWFLEFGPEPALEHRPLVPVVDDVISRISSALGERFGNHTSNQFCFAYWAFGTPRGRRLTVPIRRPSAGWRGVPSRTIVTAMRKILVA